MYLRQSTSVAISFGPFVAFDDGVTIDASMVSFIDHGTTGIKLSKNGGALTIRAATVTASTYDSYGNYIVTLSATDTNTIGRLRVQFNDGSAVVPVWQDFTVLDEAVYDWMFGTKAPLTPVTAGRELVVDAAGLADANVVKVGPTGSGTAQTAGDIYNVLTGVNDDTNDLINATDTLVLELAKVPKSDGTASWNATAAAQIQTEANDALVANNLDHLVLSAVDADFATTVHLNSVIGHLADNGTSATFDRTTDSMEAQRDNIGTAGAGLTAADDAVITAIAALNNITAASVWAVGARTLTAGTNIDGSTFTGIPWNAAWDAEVQSEVADALAVYDPPTHTELTAAFTEIKGATWASTDSLEAIRDRGDAAWITATGFSTLTAADVRTAVGLASANLDTQLADIPTVAEMEARTLVAASYATAASIAALNNLSSAQVTAAVPTAAANAAAWGASIVGNSRTRDMYLQGLVNKISFAADGLTYTVYASDDSTELATGTATRLATSVGGLRSVDPA